MRKNVLKEIDKPRQVDGELHRRWFADSESDLIIWEEEGAGMAGFQFCYGKGRDERALNWKREVGFSHSRIDDGEGRQFRYKSTPILSPDCDREVEVVENEFLKRSSEIDAEITSFVLNKIAEYGEEGVGV